MPFKVTGYKRLENRETIEVRVQNLTLDIGGLVHISGRLLRTASLSDHG